MHHLVGPDAQRTQSDHRLSHLVANLQGPVEREMGRQGKKTRSYTDMLRVQKGT